MINIRMQNETTRLRPRITVAGVGGTGGNVLNNMIQSSLEGCEFLACNTDAQALDSCLAEHKVQLGTNVTRGLGAGANPEVGRAAAEESIDDVMNVLEGSNMVFVTAGMGGGTGTGAASVVAQAAREAGILTIGVVTKPFHFEGSHRMKLAESGISELQKHVDTLIVIPNQNLFRIANEKTTFSDAFKMADEVLQSGVRSVTDLMVKPGLINLDFADIRAVMAEMGKAMMGTGEAAGERRAVEASEAAISNPLLDDVSMKGAKGVLINITGGMDMTMFEVDEAANRIRDEVDTDANIIFGSTLDERLDGVMRVSVVATGIEASAMKQDRPAHLASPVGEPTRRGLYAEAGQEEKEGKTGRAGSGGSFAGGAAAGGTKYRAVSNNSFQGVPADRIPASIIPTNVEPVNAAYASGNSGAVATASNQAQQQAVEKEEGHVDMGYASAENVGGGLGAAVARKLDEANVEPTGVHTRPEETQSIERPTSGMTTQPRAQLHNDSFIPPQPVDPSASTSGQDLFGDGDFSLEPRAQKAAEKSTKRSPSFFERFSLGGSSNKQEEEVVEIEEDELEAGSAFPTFSVAEGGKSNDESEDELDIPAFLRRQMN